MNAYLFFFVVKVSAFNIIKLFNVYLYTEGDNWQKRTWVLFSKWNKS